MDRRGVQNKPRSVTYYFNVNLWFGLCLYFFVQKEIDKKICLLNVGKIDHRFPFNYFTTSRPQTFDVNGSVGQNITDVEAPPYSAVNIQTPRPKERSTTTLSTLIVDGSLDGSTSRQLNEDGTTNITIVVGKVVPINKTDQITNLVTTTTPVTSTVSTTTTTTTTSTTSTSTTTTASTTTTTTTATTTTTTITTTTTRAGLVDGQIVRNGTEEKNSFEDDESTLTNTTNNNGGFVPSNNDDRSGVGKNIGRGNEENVAQSSTPKRGKATFWH